jgi:hypothetical protein
MWGVYKRHTPFAMITEKINIQDNCIRIPRRGDLLSYMYLMRFSKSTGLAAPWDSSIVNSWKLFIGQELIDTQDSVFSLSVAPGIMARTYARSTIQNGAYFCPIQFWFCNDLPLPLVALQYDDVTIRMDWTPDPGYYYECYFNFVLLAEEERQWFASTAHEISIYQVNKLTNTSDVVLRNPVNFIASDPIKLPTTFQYGITINGKQLRTMYNSHGAQLYAQTDTSRILPATSDPYPPIAMSTDTQAIVTPYSIGTFSIVVSGNTQTSYAFNLHDGNPATFWTTPGQTVASQTVTYTAAASSNVSNAWMAFDRQGNTWVSGISTYTGFDPTTSGIYVANSNQVVDNSNAWLAFDNNASTYWNSNTLYGNQYSKYAVTHTVSASSNLVQQPEYLAVDGNTSTFFTSNTGAAGNIYYLDMLGTYTMNASSSTTKIEFAFDGSPSTYWESNAYGAYGVTVAQGTYTSSASSTQGGPGNEYLAFDPSIAGTAWQSLTSYGSTANVTTSFTVSASSNLSPGTEYTVLTGGSWSSNTQNSTYGYSTLYGNYASNSSYNLATSYLPFSTSGTPIGWSSNSVYGNTWTRGTYTIQASSNVTPTWNISNWFQAQPFVSGNIYGYSVPLGTYGANASPLSSPTVAWQAFAGTGWGTASNYGANTVTGATFTFSSSRGTGTEWQPFNQTLGGSWNPGVGYYGSNTFTAAPNVVSVTQGTTTTSSIQLSFPLASGATGYVITTNPATSSNVTTTSPYTFNGLTSGQSYIFYVTSWNLAGQGGTQSNTFITISPAVTGFSVILGQASVSSVTLQWNASYGAATYNITSSPASSPTTQSTSGTSLTVTGLPNPGTNYTFTIVAINSGGTSSTTTTMAYTAPGAATLTQGTTTANSMTVSWTAVTTATSYNVTASGADGSYSQNLGVTGTSTTLTGLNPGVQYTVQITTLSSAGTGATSTSSFTTAPDVVTGLTVTSSPNITSLTVAWSNAATATSYLANIYYSNGTFVSSQTVSTTNAATFTGLTANTNYYVIITSKSAVGTGNTTGQLSTGTGPSTTVTSLTQTAATTSSLTATFSANGGTNFASSLYDTNNNLVASSVSTSLSVTFGGLGISSGFTLKVAQVNASGYVGNPVSLVCTTGFILDQLSSTSYSALYSLYRVTYAYAGPVFRLTNAAQTSQQDFYAWVDKTLWTSPNGTGTSVASWIAANGGTGYMRTWYDQSGLALHATQTTASLQPIYSNSRVDMTSGAYFNLPAGAIPYGVSQYTVTCKLPTVPSPLSTNVIYCGGTNSGTGSLNGLHVNSSGFTSWWNSADATAVVTPGANYVVTNMFQYNNTRTIWINNSRFYYRTSDIARQNAGNASSPNFIGYSNYFGALYGTLAYISFFNAPLGTSDRNIVESQ